MMLLLFMLKEMLTEFIFWYMSKNDKISIMNNSNLIDKKMRFIIFFNYI